MRRVFGPPRAGGGEEIERVMATEKIKGFLKKPPRRYREIFWDRPDLARMSPGELKEYLERNRKRRLVYDAVLRRFIECNLLSEALEFFPLEEIERGLKTFKFWKSPEWRLCVAEGVGVVEK